MRNRSILLLCLGAWALGCGPSSTPPPTTDAATDAGAKDSGAPATDTPATDTPATDTPTVDVPATDTPTTEDAATDAPVSDGATGDVPSDAPQSCPEGQTRCGEACVDTASSLVHCGACDRACAPTNATGLCTMGTCAIATCTAGYGNCDDNAATGCETDLNTTAPHCGACGRACAPANATAACVMGSCGIGTCTAGFGDCDEDPANGCETNTNTTATSCGACGTACSLANATPGCAMGACTVAACAEGFGDCDNNAANGCESPLNTNTHCGACGTACAAGTRCAAGMCVSTCPMGTTFCSAADICANTNTDTSHCGGCGMACAARANSAVQCSAGACSYTCNAGFGDCDGNAANGCEANLNTTATACGACGRACSVQNATATCAGGMCAVGTCNMGFADCDNDPANGCETNLNTTVTACGSCGTACSLSNATPSCEAGRCAVGSCNAGFANCDGNAANGCETPTTTNSNCGACGRACEAGTRCAGGMCVSSCPEGTNFCSASGVCADFQSDTSNCGMCGTLCPSLSNASPLCTGGSCTFVCNAGFADCDGNRANGCETNLRTSTASCGACGRACAPENGIGACSQGSCGIAACQPGYADCNGSPVDGCESNLASSTTTCGSCTGSCAPSNGVGACAMGRCTVAMCSSGFGDCDSNAINGCETRLDSNLNCGACGRACGTGTFCAAGTCVASCSAPTNYCSASMTCVDFSVDTNNCGACGNVCPRPGNGIPTCVAGSCGIACNAGFANCDGNASNGCEADLNSSTATCGTCSTRCTLGNATPTCNGGACAVASCNAGFGNCDNNPSNGCETNLATTAAHCGACGNVCRYTNAAGACMGGGCALGTCTTGWGNCDNNPSNGCETSLNTSSNCGACGNRCTGSTTCSNGVCVGSCPTGTTRCTVTGTCSATQTDVNNCGTCGNVCPTYPNYVRACASGMCGGACATGWGNCDSNLSNGCETNLLISASNCGACGTVCRLANATSVCASGGCAVGACTAGFANCDGVATNGCEAALATDGQNCGACGRGCPSGTTCRLGICRP